MNVDTMPGKQPNGISIKLVLPSGEDQVTEQFLSIIELAKCIGQGEKASLRNIHQRKFLPGVEKRQNTTITEFINNLAETGKDKYGHRAAKISNIEFAQDLTIDKFSRMPDPGLKRQGVDCRFYFNAFVKKMSLFAEENPDIFQLALEAKSISILEGLIKRHYYLSLKEAYRCNNPNFSRYNWSITGGTICINMPVTITGRDRGKWLRQHISNPDSARPGEKRRIQNVIDQHFEESLTVSYDERIDYGQVQEEPDDCEGLNKFDLGKAVAAEKVKIIDQLRPSIKKLGPHLLKSLIETIFMFLEEGCFDDGKIAAEFGISKATFSRFAGSNWLKTENGIPDLWLNTAEVVMACPNLRNIVNTKGIREIVQQRT